MIIEEMGKTEATVSSIEIGKCFKSNGHFYMKIDENPMGKGNIVAVNLAFGTVNEFESNYYVEPVTAKVVIE